MYTIEFSENAAKTLRKLPEPDYVAILKKLNSIRESPYSYLKKLTGNKFWRLRIGKYRAVIDVLIKGRIIYVVKIDKRDRIY